MAACVGLGQESLSRFESGRGEALSLAQMLTLLDTLGLEIDFKPTTRRPTLNDLLDERRKGNNSGPGAK